MWRRLLAVVCGTSIPLLLEVSLRVSGFGGPGERPDPFAGFASDTPLFVRDVDTAGESVLRTADNRLAAFNYQSFPLRKLAGTVRIFCLGGSSTFGFPYDANHSFCAALGAALTAIRPKQRFELINCGGMSYGSHRELGLIRELVRYEPDGFILYTGHNEYVERRFYAPLLNEPSWRQSARRAVSGLRLTALVERAIAPLRRARAPAGSDLFGVGLVRDDSRRLPRSSLEDERIEEAFRFALAEVEALARRSHAALWLVKPASNLRGWAPEASDWRTDLDPRSQRQRDAAFASANALLAGGQPREALRQIDEALRIDDRAASVHFVRGRILEAMAELDAARNAYEAARDRDGVPIRMPSNLGRAIADAWRAYHLPALDAEDFLARESPDGIVGDEMILDYCHPTPEGHRRIAAFLLGPVQLTLWPDEAPRPFDFSRLSGVGEEDVSTSAFGAAWVGQMRLRQGRAGESIAPFRRALALNPTLATAHEGLGRALAEQGNLREAVLQLETASRLAPGIAGTWNNLGLVYSSVGRPEEALAAFQRALRLGAGSAVVRSNLAGVLADLGRLQEARSQIEQALAVSPTDVNAWLRLGDIAARQGERDRALSAYQRALSLDPTSARARSGLEAMGSLP